MKRILCSQLVAALPVGGALAYAPKSTAIAMTASIPTAPAQIPCGAAEGRVAMANASTHASSVA
jgi:hypothetical protein